MSTLCLLENQLGARRSFRGHRDLLVERERRQECLACTVVALESSANDADLDPELRLLAHDRQRGELAGKIQRQFGLKSTLPKMGDVIEV